MHRLRVRGIYATALTEHLADVGRVVGATPPIEARFDADFPTAEHDVAVETTADRLGVGVHGAPRGVEAVRERLVGVGLDVLAWADEAPLGAVFDAEVSETLGSGAVVDLGPRDAFLPYDAVDGRVEAGDERRVQVHEPAAPWADRRPAVGERIEAPGGLLTLVRGRDSPRADVQDAERASELVRTTEMLPTDPPAGWGVRWERGAADADVEALDAALADAGERAAAVDAHLDGAEPPLASAWVRFGRDSRFALDDVRRRVLPTMPGHHRIKAGGSGASRAVDLVERLHAHDRDVADDDGSDVDAAPDGAGGEAGAAPGDAFPFEAVADTFGPSVGDEIAVRHGKPDGRQFALGRGEVVGRDGDTVTLRRTMTAGGDYDALGVPREAGDVAVTTLREGRWWYPTVYRDEAGTAKGTYVNVCTPVELFPDAAVYVDLHVDVVRHADGTVERVDDDELDDAVEAGDVPEALAERARSVATAVERALS